MTWQGKYSGFWDLFNSPPSRTQGVIASANKGESVMHLTIQTRDAPAKQEILMKEERFMEGYGRMPIVRVSWPAIFAGTLFGFAIMLLLGLCGLAIGPTMVHPAEVRTWAGIWSLVTVFVGFLGGGWLAAKTLSGAKQDGWLHGMLVWGLGSMAIFYFAVNG